MSASALLKELRNVPYGDMMILARELQSRLSKIRKESMDAGVLADALNSLTDMKIPKVDDHFARENEILKVVFKRQRAFNITSVPGGWKIQMSGGVTTQHAELKTAFSQLLDTVIVANALTGK